MHVRVLIFLMRVDFENGAGSFTLIAPYNKASSKDLLKQILKHEQDKVKRSWE